MINSLSSIKLSDTDRAIHGFKMDVHSCRLLLSHQNEMPTEEGTWAIKGEVHLSNERRGMVKFLHTEALRMKRNSITLA
ncbi:hypothetical protein CEXT_29451 [Caerostris extrusa]|uniref:Uncharacterized protein n=1 Tax=Caerostris extrusa TaxID=172846 RepID=A0AAV4XX35_CAEEX|nr:hypothetical protein CEXT_29451 [Caerostris extrusa]